MFNILLSSLPSPPSFIGLFCLRRKNYSHRGGVWRGLFWRTGRKGGSRGGSRIFKRVIFSLFTLQNIYGKKHCYQKLLVINNWIWPHFFMEIFIFVFYHIKFYDKKFHRYRKVMLIKLLNLTTKSAIPTMVLETGSLFTNVVH